MTVPTANTSESPTVPQRIAEALGATGTILLLFGVGFSKAAQNIGMALALLGLVALLFTPGRRPLWHFLKGDRLAWLIGTWILYLVALSLGIHWFSDIQPENLPQETWRLSRLFLILLVAFWVARTFKHPMTPIWILLSGYLLGSLAFHHDAGWPFALTNGRLDLWENPQFYGLLSGAVILTLTLLATDLVGHRSSPWFWVRLVAWSTMLGMAINGFLISEARGSMLGLVLAVFVIAALTGAYWLHRTFNAPGKHSALPKVKILVALVIFTVPIILIGERTVDRFERDLEVVLPDIEYLQAMDRSSLSVRLVQWESAYGLWEERPLFGWGPGSGGLLHSRAEIPEQFHAGGSHFHNSYIDLTLWTGLVGLAIYISIFLYLLGQCVAPNKGKSNSASLLMLSILILFLVASFTQTFLTSQVSWFFIASFIGVLYGLLPGNGKTEPSDHQNSAFGHIRTRAERIEIP